MIVANEAEMRVFGEQLALRLKAGDWVAIDGTLGAGKTVLCAGILRGLGYEGEVASPSYAIVHQYDATEVRIAVTHADLYRINNLDEIEELGLTDGRDDCITLVEWAKNGGALFGKPTYSIEITPLTGGDRQIDMKEGHG
jgi:tRNA threonylcarbamoyladenosine biosynthesis protein TsaE